MKLQNLLFCLFMVFIVGSIVITATLIKDFYTQFNFYFIIIAITFVFIGKNFGDE